MLHPLRLWSLRETRGGSERYSFDPWGKRRDPGSWLTPAPGTFSFDPVFGDRGYTGHEHIDHLGLVNMNGRVYDPELGKFLSADPFVQFPESTQGYNRYAYVGNNPLSFVDPSGFSFFKRLFAFALGIVMFAIAPEFSSVWQKWLWRFVVGSLYLHAAASLPIGTSTAGAGQIGPWGGLPRGPPGGLGTPGINPTSTALGPARAAAEREAQQGVGEQLAGLLARAVRTMRYDDASARTNSEGKSSGGKAVDTDSFDNVTWLAVAIDVAVGTIPGVGTLIGVYDAYGVLTDADSTTGDRVYAVISILPGGKIAKVLARTHIVQSGIQRVAKTASGKRVEDFTRTQRARAKQRNADEHGGEMQCVDCSKPVRNVRNEKGIPTPDDQAQVHHDPSISSGGTRNTSQAVVLCPPCHRRRHSSP